MYFICTRDWAFNETGLWRVGFFALRKYVCIKLMWENVVDVKPKKYKLHKQVSDWPKIKELDNAACKLMGSFTFKGVFVLYMRKIYIDIYFSKSAFSVDYLNSKKSVRVWLKEF